MTAHSPGPEFVNEPFLVRLGVKLGFLAGMLWVLGCLILLVMDLSPQAIGGSITLAVVGMFLLVIVGGILGRVASFLWWIVVWLLRFLIN